MIFLFNMGLPMIIPAFYLMVPGLIPIVLVESLLIARQMQWRFKSSLIRVTCANIVSTLIGIPITWFILFGAETLAAILFEDVPLKNTAGEVLLITIGAAWIPPLPPDAEWVIFPAMGSLLIWFFLASWAVEYLVIKALHSREGGVAGPELRRAVRNANVASYLLLEFVVLSFYPYNEFG